MARKSGKDCSSEIDHTVCLPQRKGQFVPSSQIKPHHAQWGFFSMGPLPVPLPPILPLSPLRPLSALPLPKKASPCPCHPSLASMQLRAFLFSSNGHICWGSHCGEWGPHSLIASATRSLGGMNVVYGTSSISTRAAVPVLC